jgi:hypothetical protein
MRLAEGTCLCPRPAKKSTKAARSSWDVMAAYQGSMSALAGL